MIHLYNSCQIQKLTRKPTPKPWLSVNAFWSPRLSNKYLNLIFAVFSVQTGVFAPDVLFGLAHPGSGIEKFKLFVNTFSGEFTQASKP